MRRLLPCVARCSLLPFCVGCCSVLLCAACCSVLLAACYPFASAAVLCCPFALPGLLRRCPAGCFPMLPLCLPCRVSRGAATLPHRLPLRSIPPPRFACGASHSRGTWASTVWAEEFPTPLEMSLHGLNLLRQTQICRPICTDCLRHLRISAE